jgi:DNA-binding GntR family transcriptional regulator
MLVCQDNVLSADCRRGGAMPILDLAVSHSSPIPIYHQISQQLEHMIAVGELAKGDFLPSEVELAERWGISRPTARRAIQELVEKGLLVRKRGVGTQVVNAQLQRTMKLSSLHGDLVAAGRKPTTHVRLWQEQQASALVAETLDIAIGSPVMYLERLRLANGRPLALMHNWLRHDITYDITLAQLQAEGLYDLLRARRIRPRIAHQSISARAATDAEAEILGLDVGAALLTMRRAMQDDSGRTVELGEHAYDASHYSVEMTVVDS